MNSMMAFCRLLAACVMVVLTAGPAAAQTSTEREIQDSVAFAYANAKVGPATLPLRGLATLDLPKEFVFVNAEASKRLSNGVGHGAGDSLLGLILPANTFSGWYLAVNALDTGHVTREAMTKLDLVDVHGAVRSLIRKGNAARAQLGSGPIDIGTWVEPPKQDAAKHRFTTAIRIFESGPSMGGDDSVHLSTALFGRTTAIEITLVVPMSDLGRHRGAHERIVNAVSYLPGQRAEDFVDGKDKVARHLIDVVFGGRSHAEIEAELAEEVADAKRRAALPQPMDRATQMKLLLGGLLGVVALALLVFAFRGGRSQPASSSATNRTMRSAPRR
jgi:uncharacterized membrane-anchored protein